MIKDLLYTMSTAVGLVTCTGVAAPLAIAMSVRGERATDPVVKAWARGLLLSAGVEVVVEGTENLPPGQCVFVSNHQSHFDVPAIFANIDRHLRFVAKAELAKIPIFGHAIRATGNVVVDRRGGQKDRETMSAAVHAVRERVNLLFFAEGTRSEDGHLQPFKKGAFIMALEANVPIVPMAVAGTRHILPKNVKWIRGGRKVALVIGKPISTEGMKLDQRDPLMKTTRAEIETLFARANELAGDTPGGPA